MHLGIYNCILIPSNNSRWNNNIIITVIIEWRFLGRTFRLHELTPLGAILRSLPRRVEAYVVLLDIEFNRSKPGSS